MNTSAPRPARPGRQWLYATAVFVTAVASCVPAQARGVYQTPADFLAETFPGTPPPPGFLWLRETLVDQVKVALGHDLPGLRVRYWLRDGRSAWVLEEIGKEKPITVGFVVAHGAIERMRVLIFRESRGYEVRHGAFTEQFEGARLEEDYRLDRSIDGISGATLSVDALTRLARTVLVLDRYREQHAQ